VDQNTRIGYCRDLESALETICIGLYDFPATHVAFVTARTSIAKMPAQYNS